MELPAQHYQSMRQKKITKVALFLHELTQKKLKADKEN